MPNDDAKSTLCGWCGQYPAAGPQKFPEYEALGICLQCSDDLEALEDDTWD